MAVCARWHLWGRCSYRKMNHISIIYIQIWIDWAILHIWTVFSISYFKFLKCVVVLSPNLCCNTATCAVLHARIFNTWPLILKYLYYLIFLFIPKNKVFSNTDPSSSIRNVHVFSNTVNVKYWVLKNKIGFFLNMLEKLQAKIPSQTSRKKFQANYCKLKIASQNC